MDALNQILVVVALVVGGISTLQLGTVRSLRADREDYKERDANRVAEIAALTAKVVTLENDRDALQRSVRGDDHFDALAVKVDMMIVVLNGMVTMLTEHNDAAKTHWQQEILLLTALRDSAASRLPEGDS